jgi:hypothetical protein
MRFLHATAVVLHHAHIIRRRESGC